jgi:hypothetical protein
MDEPMTVGRPRSDLEALERDGVEVYPDATGHKFSIDGYRIGPLDIIRKTFNQAESKHEDGTA